jgi:MFS superfamily sulfate permease-like transporter
MDLALMFITFTLSVVWDLEIGIIVSLIIALLLVVRRSSKTRMTVLVSISNFRSLNLSSPTLWFRAVFPVQVNGSL